MADNVAVTAGTGTTIAADEVVDGTLGTVKVQYVKLMDGTLDGTTKAAVGAAGLKVDGSGATQPVSGTVTAAQATAANLNATVVGTGTFAVQAAATLAAETTKVIGTVNLSAAQTLGTVTNLSQMGGVAIALNTGVRSTGTQRVTIATDDLVPVTGTITAVTAITNALPAGSAIMGKVGIDQTTPGTTDSVSVKSQAFSAAVSLTRTADTNAYAANDVIGAATGSTAALTFSSMGPSAGRIMITSASFEIDAAAIISGETSYRLYLYNVTPPSALGDNTAWDLPSGDRASFLGYVDLGTPVDLGSTLYVESNIINKQLLLSGTSLFGYLVTNGAYTPTSARVHKITLHAVSV